MRGKHSLTDNLSCLALSSPHRRFATAASALSSPEWFASLGLSYVLGGDAPEGMGSHSVMEHVVGHTGCVNALDWEDGGQSRLASGGDDTKICLWAPSMDSATGGMVYKVQDSIATGHTQNIFSVKWTPYKPSSLFSCAGDGEVRVYDINHSSSPRNVASGTNSWTHHDSDGTCVRVLRCHRDRVKRISTENSPDVFLTCSEDGTVRQHDLRTSHTCPPRRRRAFLRGPVALGDEDDAACGPPLLSYPGLGLYTLTLSKARPHLFVVAGRCSTAFMHDRRMLRSAMVQDWGHLPVSPESSLTQCVRKFGIPDEKGDLSPGHIVAAQLSQTNPRDLVLSYSSGPVYLFDTDAPIYHAPLRPDPIPIPPEGGRLSSPRATRLSMKRSQESEESEDKGDEWVTQRLKRSKDEGDDSLELARRRMQEADRVELVKQEDEYKNQREHFEDRFEANEPSQSTGPDASASGTTNETMRAALDRLEEERRRLLDERRERTARGAEVETAHVEDMELEASASSSEEEEAMSEDENQEEEDQDEDEDEEDSNEDCFDEEEDLPAPNRGGWAPGVPLVAPTLEKYEGHANSETVKDVNFVGGDNFVVSGSDDGNFFIWKKDGSSLVGIWKGDESVVNVIEQHPRLPILAVSGIDSSIKIFTPGGEKSQSLLEESEKIAARNQRRRRPRGVDMVPSQALLAILARTFPQHVRVEGGGVTIGIDGNDDDEEREECILM